jgi:hypothetical protein
VQYLISMSCGRTHEHVHQWLFRRWNGFNIAANSICALICSFPFGFWIGIPLKTAWWLSVVIFICILAVVMVLAWRDTMGMLAFMASLEANKTSSSDQR